MRLSPERKEHLALVYALLGGAHLNCDNPERYGEKQRQGYAWLRKLWEQGKAELSEDRESTVYTLDGQTQRLSLTE